MSEQHLPVAPVAPPPPSSVSAFGGAATNVGDVASPIDFGDLAAVREQYLGFRRLDEVLGVASGEKVIQQLVCDI